jgi:hypothetical protein
MTGHADRSTAATWPVVLVSMPFMDIDRPSIQLGLLKAITRTHGFPVRTLHANLDFAARIGAETYGRLAQHRGRMIGDWLFSVDAFRDKAPDPRAELLDEFADELTHLGGTRTERRGLLLSIRDQEVPAYLDALVDEGPWGDTRVVGFSSTFQQNAASFALARRLKERYPRLVSVFGGANFDGEMGEELLRCVTWIDAAVPRAPASTKYRGWRAATRGRSSSLPRHRSRSSSTPCRYPSTTSTSNGPGRWDCCPTANIAGPGFRWRPPGAAGGAPSIIVCSVG